MIENALSKASLVAAPGFARESCVEPTLAPAFEPTLASLRMVAWLCVVLFFALSSKVVFAANPEAAALEASTDSGEQPVFAQGTAADNTVDDNKVAPDPARSQPDADTQPATDIEASDKTASEADEMPAAEMLKQEADILGQFEDEESALRCINSARLDRSEILSNQSIVFRMRGGANYINRLRYRCPGLAPRDTIMYETQSRQLCNLDSITVLDDLGGRFLRGARCSLGKFFPVDDETVELLKGSRSERRRARRGKGKID